MYLWILYFRVPQVGQLGRALLVYLNEPRMNHFTFYFPLDIVHTHTMTSTKSVLAVLSVSSCFPRSSSPPYVIVRGHCVR